MDENELMHFNTKGSKWNQRRYQNEDGTWTEEGKARRRAEYISKRRKWRVRDYLRLDDEELSMRVQRLRSEKEYTELMTRTIGPKSPSIMVKAGRNFTEKLLLGIGTKAANAIVGDVENFKKEMKDKITKEENKEKKEEEKETKKEIEKERKEDERENRRELKRDIKDLERRQGRGAKWVM